ncbi:hypothetical protein BP6252_01148 [Coleophoma cylindrospora]|uniref:Uncharacterized protein n=1 Tax=Coleophoma cylindrospora TaxID=1849047 RepID=A0A3D8SS27_9HELO|nr:hypothetical protein BP6252_01148 [Coleophoma cylindrospora]
MADPSNLPSKRKRTPPITSISNNTDLTSRLGFPASDKISSRPSSESRTFTKRLREAVRSYPAEGPLDTLLQGWDDHQVRRTLAKVANNFLDISGKEYWSSERTFNKDSALKLSLPDDRETCVKKTPISAANNTLTIPSIAKLLVQIMYNQNYHAKTNKIQAQKRAQAEAIDQSASESAAQESFAVNQDPRIVLGNDESSSLFNTSHTTGQASPVAGRKSGLDKTFQTMLDRLDVTAPVSRSRESSGSTADNPCVILSGDDDVDNDGKDDDNALYRTSNHHEYTSKLPHSSISAVLDLSQEKSKKRKSADQHISNESHRKEKAQKPSYTNDSLESSSLPTNHRHGERDSCFSEASNSSIRGKRLVLQGMNVGYGRLGTGRSPSAHIPARSQILSHCIAPIAKMVPSPQARAASQRNSIETMTGIYPSGHHEQSPLSSSLFGEVDTEAISALSDGETDMLDEEGLDMPSPTDTDPFSPQRHHSTFLIAPENDQQESINDVAETADDIQLGFIPRAASLSPELVGIPEVDNIEARSSPAGYVDSMGAAQFPEGVEAHEETIGYEEPTNHEEPTDHEELASHEEPTVHVQILETSQQPKGPTVGSPPLNTTPDQKAAEQPISLDTDNERKVSCQSAANKPKRPKTLVSHWVAYKKDRSTHWAQGQTQDVPLMTFITNMSEFIQKPSNLFESMNISVGTVKAIREDMDVCKDDEGAWRIAQQMIEKGVMDVQALNTADPKADQSASIRVTPYFATYEEYLDEEKEILIY